MRLAGHDTNAIAHTPCFEALQQTATASATDGTGIALNQGMKNETTVHFYKNATEIVRTRTYATRALAWAAIQRAAKRGQSAAFASVRTSGEAPTCHH